MGERLVRTAFVVALILGFAVASGAPVGVATTHPVERSHTDSQQEISVTIDCNASEVQVDAPRGVQYVLRTSLASVQPSATETVTTTRTAAGDTTEPIPRDGVVFAFVQRGGQTVASAFENCETAPTAVGTPAPGQPNVTIDCNTSQVNVSAAPMETYTLQTTKIVVTPPLTQTVNDVRTAQGTSTTTVDDADVVFAFVTTGDGTVTRAFANCTDVNRTTPTPTRTPASPFPPFF
jgi:hypothetical protein